MPKLGNQPSRPDISGAAYKHSSEGVSRLGLSGDSDTSPLSLGTGSILVHQATAYAYDEVFLWVSNYGSTNNRILSLEIGGNGSFGDGSKTINIEVDKEVGLIQVYRHYRLSLTDITLGYNAGSGG